jgi:hypothetical protein
MSGILSLIGTAQTVEWAASCIRINGQLVWNASWESVIEILSPNPYSYSNDHLESVEHSLKNTAPEGLTFGSELPCGSR